ncbi:restriction endonuclease subunit S [Nostoc sp. PCC 7107]|uniref:restriction endonuclease subunit S n=1 Tax=Nostoc sp. PCC 7107 TaxID=317936 RepID=UPI00029F48F7|nr:restriction endonuclease subunit S [Nostoc sp. PCC 7107]AFY44173.1 restriction modification system DNA specificity domain protein [Nostoc sp. PCC 7107]
MEDTIIAISRLRNKKKWAYSFHSESSLQTEEYLKNTSFEIQKLGKLVAEITDGLHSTRHYVDDGIIVLAVRNITEFGLDLSNKKMINQAEHEHFKRSQVQPGDLLVTITGRLGTALVYTSEKPANLSAHVARVKVHANKVNPYYLAAYLNSNFGKQLLNEHSIGSLYPHINVNGLQNVQIILPRRHIQDRIAQIMQDAYIVNKKKLAEIEALLNNFDEFVMKEMGLSSIIFKDEKDFTVNIKQMRGGRFDLDLYNTKYINLISSLRKEFNLNLKKLVSITEPITSGTTPLNSQYLETGIPFLRVQNISNEGILNWENCLFVSEEFAQTIHRSNIKDGDILLVIVGATIGKCAVVMGVNSITVINQALARIRVKKDIPINPNYLQAFLSCPAGQIQISALKRPVAQGNLSLTETGQILIPIIPDEVQNAITKEMEHRRFLIKKLRKEAKQIIIEAKACVERMILGEEEVT